MLATRPDHRREVGRVRTVGAGPFTGRLEVRVPGLRHGTTESVSLPVRGGRAQALDDLPWAPRDLPVTVRLDGDRFDGADPARVVAALHDAALADGAAARDGRFGRTWWAWHRRRPVAIRVRRVRIVPGQADDPWPKADPDPYVRVTHDGTARCTPVFGDDLAPGDHPATATSLGLVLRPIDRFTVELWDADLPYSDDDRHGTWTTDGRPGERTAGQVTLVLIPDRTATDGTCPGDAVTTWAVVDLGWTQDLLAATVRCAAPALAAATAGSLARWAVDDEGFAWAVEVLTDLTVGGFMERDDHGALALELGLGALSAAAELADPRLRPIIGGAAFAACVVEELW